MDATCKPRVLIIEDDPGLAASTQELLDQLGYEVHWASTANKAFDEIMHDGYRAALLDLNLGTEDGVKLVLSLRAAGHPIPPLVIVSAQSPGNLRAAAETTGAVEIVHKPFEIATLKDALARALTHPHD
jgi:DNA-binding response OmpR family regulator